MDGKRSTAIPGGPQSLSRRQFLCLASTWLAGAFAAAGCRARPTTSGGMATPLPPATPAPSQVYPTGQADEFGDVVTPLEKMRQWGNYYEFTRSNQAIGEAASFRMRSPWTVQVGGLVDSPGIFDLDDLRRFGEEERVYRFRCMQAWSMVIPWKGFPLHRLLRAAGPTSEARYVRFESLYDPDQMPGQDVEGANYSAWLSSAGGQAMGRPEKDNPYLWPYAEALRLDEALHDLVLLATGAHGQPLHPENGAPVRLVVPWKYAFKSIKAVARIELVAERPVTFWNHAVPAEMGWYANVNPDVANPRWKQSREMRFLGLESEPILPTLMFNGYASQVARLYEGLDLASNF